MDQLLGDERVARGFRVKFPEDVLQDNLAGQLWFGAEVNIKCTYLIRDAYADPMVFQISTLITTHQILNTRLPVYFLHIIKII